MERSPMPKDGEVPAAGNNDTSTHEQVERGHERAAMNKSIKVLGFKNIKDGDLPVVNNYGIETGMSIHPNRDLIYELSIPLSQLGVSLDLNKPLAYNIKLNQPNKPDFKKQGMPEGGGRSEGKGGMSGGRMGSGGRGGMGGGKMGGGGQRPSGARMEGSDSRKSDFWIKYKLVKA